MGKLYFVSRLLCWSSCLSLVRCFFVNSVTNSYYDIGLNEDVNFRVNISSDGFVLWIPFLSITTSCVMDMTYFPFDKQSCSIQFTTWMYGSQKIQYFLLKDYVNLDYYSTNGVWSLVSLNASVSTTDKLPIVEIKFVLSRQPRYFILNIIIPTICLSVLSVFVFLIQPQAGEKVSVSVAILMSYSVILLMISDNIPRSDKLPIVSKYYVKLYNTHAIIHLYNCVYA